MAQIPGSVPLTGKVAPTDTLDTFATHMDIYGEGGYMTVADLTERDAISTERRKQGMAAYVNSENKLYVLKNGINNLDWVEFAGGVSLNLQEVFDTGTIAPPLGLTINDSVGILPGNSILMGTGDVVEMITGNWTSPYIPSTYIMQAQPIGYISLQCADGNPGPPNYSSGSIKLKGENVDGTVSLSLRPGGTELYTPNSFDHSLNNGSYSVHNITTYDIESNESIHLNNHTGTWTGAQEIFIENGAQYAQSNLGSSYIKLTEPAVSTGKIEIGTTWDESGVPAPSVYTSKIILGNADQSISLEANGGKAGIGGNIRLAGIGLGTPNIGDALVAKDITGNLEWATPSNSGICGFDIDCSSPGPQDGDTLVFNGSPGIWELGSRSSTLQDVFDEGTDPANVPAGYSTSDVFGELPDGQIIGQSVGDITGTNYASLGIGDAPGTDTKRIGLYALSTAGGSPDFGAISLYSQNTIGNSMIRLHSGEIEFEINGSTPVVGKVLTCSGITGTAGQVEWTTPTFSEICGAPIDCSSPGPQDGDTLVFNGDLGAWEIENNGTTYFVVAGDINDVEIQNRIDREVGKYTQFVWYRNTINLTSMSLDQFNSLVELYVQGNDLITSVEIPNLINLWSNANIDNNPLLVSIDLPDLEKCLSILSINGNVEGAPTVLDNINLPSLLEVNTLYIRNVLGTGIDISNLKSGEELYFSNILNPVSLNLSSLETVHQIYFEQNNITDIDLSSLIEVEEEVWINDNSGLINVDLTNLSAMTGDSSRFTAINNLNLLNIDLPALIELDSVNEGAIEIRRNDSLLSVSANLIENIGGDVRIAENSVITNISFSSLINYSAQSEGLNEGEFVISENPSLNTLDFSNLAKMCGFSFINNAFIDISFPQLTTIEGGTLTIANEPLLESINLPSLFNSPSGSLWINSNSNLIEINVPNLIELESLELSGNNLLGSTSPGLIDLSSLNSILEIFSFVENSNLTSLDFLPSLNSVGTLYIVDNMNLTSIDLSSLTEITSSFQVDTNHSLVDLDISNLSNVKNILAIKNNSSLTTIDLSSIVSFSGGFGGGTFQLWLENNNLSDATLDDMFNHFGSLSPLITNVYCNISGQVTGGYPTAASLAARNLLTSTGGWYISY